MDLFDIWNRKDEFTADRYEDYERKGDEPLTDEEHEEENKMIDDWWGDRRKEDEEDMRENGRGDIPW